MANVHTTLSSLFTDIANAIRSKTGSTSAITADNFPAEIENLRTGFDYSNQNVTSISDNEFKNCTDLKSVDCYNLTAVGVSAFEGCTNLKSVTLYDGVKTVGENAFKGCDCVIYCKSASIPETWHENWNPDNCLVLFGDLVETWDIYKTSENNVTAELYGVDGDYTLFIYGSGRIPSYTSTSMPWYTYRSDITSSLISDSVTSIGNYAFAECTNLTSITIPDSVTSIGEYAFCDCTNLTSITIPDSVTSIGSAAFQGCSSLTSITIPDGVTSIGFYAFFTCVELKSIVIPDSVTRINGYAFSLCTDLTSITYTGTMAQWNTIRFISTWNQYSGAYTIHCTDGDIAKS